MRLTTRIGTVLAAAVSVAAFALPASASVHHHAAALPSTITIQMTDHGDTNVLNQYWAKDSSNNITTVTCDTAGNCTAHMVLEGSFVTIPGEATPNNGTVLVKSNSVVGAKATLAGAADYTFTASQAPLPSGTLVKAPGDLPRLGDMIALAFPVGTVIGGPGLTAYSITYRQTCPQQFGTQTAVQSTTGNTGNIYGCV